jgi:hypothetical protein
MAKFKTFDELYRAILGVLPEATTGEDLDGQLIVYTGLEILEDDSVHYYSPEDGDGE